MKTPNPLRPQGALPLKGRSHVPIIVSTILALHFVLLGALLIAGCKPTTTGTAYNEPETNGYATLKPWEEPTNPNPFEATGSSVPPPAHDGFDVPPAGGGTPPPAGGTPGIVAPGTGTVPPPTPGPGPTSELPPERAPTPAPPAPAPAPPAPTGGTITERVHVVASGDNLFKLARDYNVKVSAIQRANPNIKATSLQIGDKLTIPAPEPPGPAATIPTTATTGRTYVVRSGDSLSRIARDNDTTVAKLRAANSLRTDRIRVGQKLVLPQ